MRKTVKRNAWQASLVQKTAEITGFSGRHVRRVINGEFDNELIMNTYMKLYEGENELLKEVKNAVPFS